MYRLKFSQNYRSLLLLIALLFMTACRNSNSVSNREALATDTSSTFSSSDIEIDENSSVEIEDEERKEIVFPKSTCGEPAPKSPSEYPVTFFPVVITNSSENLLEQIKNDFCNDAYIKIDEKTGESIIKVASFISRDNASDFLEILEREISGGQISEPVVLAELPGDDVSLASGSAKAIEDSKLSQSQRDLLKEISTMDDPDRPKQEVSVIVPFYIPSGFNVDSVKQTVDGFAPKGYEIVYKNSNNACFSVSGEFVPFASPHAEGAFTQIEKGLFEGIYVFYEEYDSITDGLRMKASALSWHNEVNGWAYDIVSPAHDYEYVNEEWIVKEPCGKVDLEQFVKVIESMDYLFPTTVGWHFTSEYKPEQF